MLDPLLILASEALDDLEQTRIANENRLRTIQDIYHLKGSPQEAELSGLVEAIAELEHTAELTLRKAIRKHPLYSWVKSNIGVGEKQAGRLLAVLGDPYMRPVIIGFDGRTEPERPRSVSELWAYAGYHVVDQMAAHHRRGTHGNWNPRLRSRTWLVANSCIKHAHSPYRAVYDRARAHAQEAVHPRPCVRCGPGGNPAITGSPLNAGHQHARALRAVSKAILRDLWLAAREYHAQEYVQTPVP